jgi:hypothetical protein
MQSTLKLHQTDSGATYPIAPEVTLEPRAGQGSPDPVHEILSLLSQRRAQKEVEVLGDEPQPSTEMTPDVDVTFRASDVAPARVAGDRSAFGRWARNASVAFVFALCSALAAAVWSHHGREARQMISSWMPPFAVAAFDPEQTPAPAPPPAQATTSDQALAQPAPAAQPDAPAPAIAASNTDSPLLTSMARDLAAMGQQIEQLKASIAQLRDSQAQMSRDVARNFEAMNSEKVAALPPRPVAAPPPRKPRPIPPPVPAMNASTVPPPYHPAYAAPPVPAPPPPQTTVQPDGEPVVRPPMPLH